MSLTDQGRVVWFAFILPIAFMTLMVEVRFITRHPSRPNRPVHRPSAPIATSLYRFFDGGGSLLYVGITSRGEARFHEHARTQPWWPYVATCTVEHFADRPAAAAAELVAIRDELPMWNVAGALR
jgi:hypothetical protein